MEINGTVDEAQAVMGLARAEAVRIPSWTIC